MLPGLQRPQNFRRHQAAHGRLHALREGAGSGQYRARPGARHRTAAGNLARHAPGGRGGGPAKRPLAPPPPIDLPLDWLERKLGKTWAADEVRDILERLAFGVTEAAPGVFSVTVPSWRATKDISIKDDLVEEVGPHGRATIPSRRGRPPCSLPCRPPTRSARSSTRVRAIFRRPGLHGGLQLFVPGGSRCARLRHAPGGARRVANPIASDQALMRMSLLPELAATCSRTPSIAMLSGCSKSGCEIHKQTPGLPR